MRVVVVSHMFPSTVNPNHGRFIFDQVKALVDLGVGVRVVQPVPWAPKLFRRGRRWQGYRQVAREPIQGGIARRRLVYPQPPAGALNSIGSFGMVAPLTIALLRLRRTFEFELIHAHTMTPDGFAAVIAGKVLGVPVVVSGRGSDVHEYPWRGRLPRQFARFAITRCQRFICVSDALASEAGRITGRDPSADVIYNGVDTAQFAPAAEKQIVRARLGLPNTATILLCVGALVPEKGISELIEAFEALARSHSDVILLVLGDGPLRGELDASQQRLTNRCRVIHPGTVSSEQVAGYMSAVDVLVHPSHAEGLPNVVLEAMASGLPVVASKVGGIPEVVQHGATGLLVTPGDPAALLSALIRICESPEWAGTLGRSGREYVLKHHTWRKNATRHLELYRLTVQSAHASRRGEE